MPLIVMTGVPSSGKTSRAQELKEFFEQHNKEVHIISEEQQIVKAGFTKDVVYADSNKEKHIRGLLKSEMLKLIGPNNIVIFDGLNYIKGYRYELYCGSKANKCTQCTVQTEINREEAWIYNENRQNEAEKYSRTTFDALVMRYEDPDKKNRWDSPLFVTYPGAELDTEEIYKSLLKKPLPKPNMSTENPALSATNFLFDFDRVTKRITDEIVEAKNHGRPEIVLKDSTEPLRIDDSSIQEIMNLRRQYLTYAKMQKPDIEKLPQLFIQYLRTSLK